MQKIRGKIYAILRWSEKYTKTDMIYLAKGGGWLTFGQIFSALIAFMMSVAFANLLAKSTYGLYQFVLAVAGIIGAFSLSGMHTALIQSVSRSYDKTLRTAFKDSLLWSFPAFLIAIIASAYYFIQQDTTLAISLAIVAFFNPLLQSARVYGAYLNGKKDFKKITLYKILLSVIPSVFILLVILFQKSVVTLIFIYFFTHTALTIIFYLKTSSSIRSESKIDSNATKYGKHLSLMNIITTVASQADKIVIFHFLGAVEVSVYAFAIVIPEYIKGLLKNVRILALPQFARQTKESIAASIWKKTFYLFFISGLIALTYIIAAPIIFNLFYPNYAEAVTFSQVYALSIILIGGGFAAILLESHKMVRAKYKISFISALIKIVSLLILAKLFGLWGVIASAIITQVVTTILSFYFALSNTAK